MSHYDKLVLRAMDTNEDRIRAFRQQWQELMVKPVVTDKPLCNECMHGSGACQEHDSWDDQFVDDPSCERGVDTID
jgi:hypothetical protein